MISQKNEPFDPAKFELPPPQLFTYYLLGAILTGPLIILSLPALWFRYSTLKYSFEENGLRMSVGVFFRRESVTAYRRIQDIHVSSNVVQRWLGISTISIQTASGSSLPEIVIEGVTEPEKMRDWLYERLRGAKGEKPAQSNASLGQLAVNGASSEVEANETTQLHIAIRDNLSEMLRKQGSPS
jgi:putative membrane protein